VADDEVGALLEEREEARAARDFARADEIRDRLAKLGWEVRDSPEGAKLVPRG
jgi:cysteinyl-tRNA synthetase